MCTTCDSADNDEGPSWVSSGLVHLAEGVGFEPTETQNASTVFETGPFVHSGTLPPGRLAAESARADRRLRGAFVPRAAAVSVGESCHM